MKVLLISAIADAASAIQAAEWRSSASTSSSAATAVQSHSYPASSSHGRQQPKKVFAMMKANLKRFDFQGYCQRPLAALKEDPQWKKMQGRAWPLYNQFIIFSTKQNFRATLQHHLTSFSDAMAAEKLPTSCAPPAKLLTIVQLNVRSESYNRS